MPVRLPLTLAETSHWLRLFDPRGGNLFVPTRQPPEAGAEVLVDLVVVDGGPRVLLKGTVLWRRPLAEGRDPAGCVVGIAGDQRVKVNFVNAFVRGGIINRRERRRLPLRLKVGYTAGKLRGTAVSRDINEEGIFVISEQPLPEDTVVELVVALPYRDAPLAVAGVVGHTVIPEDDDVPGMGIRFARLDDQRRAAIASVIDELEDGFYAGTLPEELL